MVGQPLTRELARREVDANKQRVMRRIVEAPLLDLAADFTKSPVSDRQNQPALLCMRNKIHGRHQSALWMNPADQRFKSNNSARRKFDFRLVVKHKLALLKGVAKIRFVRPFPRDAYRRAGLSQSISPEAFAQPAQFQLAGNHIGEAFP